MTWAFVYLAVLIVGLLMAGVAGMLRRLPFVHHDVIVPHADQIGARVALPRRLGVGLTAFGLVGLALSATSLSQRSVLGAAAIGAAVAAALVVALARRRCAPALDAEHATVLRAIPPGGYGQVRVERAGVAVVMAARSIDDVEIPAGSPVAVVDCRASVLTVQRAPARP